MRANVARWSPNVIERSTLVPNVILGGDHRATLNLASLEIAFFVVANVGKPQEGKDRDGKHQQKDGMQE